MLDNFAIIGMTIAVTQIIKENVPYFKTKKGKLVVPVIIFSLAGVLNLLNAVVFDTGTITLMQAFKNGLDYGLYASGTYGIGRTYLSKENQNEKTV